MNALVLEPPTPDIHYIVFCRIVDIISLNVTQIAGAQMVLLDLAGKFELSAHQPSIYGRIYFAPNARVAVSASKSLLEASAEKGVRLAIGVARGRLHPNQDFGDGCLQGPAICTAARLATLESAEDCVVVDSYVHGLVGANSEAAGLIFSEEKTDKVKQTKLKFRKLIVLPGIKKVEPPTAPSTGPTEGIIVVYDIAGFSQKEETIQWKMVNHLQKCVKKVASALNLQALVDTNSLWYAPGGDGGAFIFNGPGESAKAFRFAKQLASKCKGNIGVRIGIADGLIAIVGNSLPVGEGVLSADTCSSYPPVGKICVASRFWVQRVTKEEQRTWSRRRHQNGDAWILRPKRKNPVKYETLHDLSTTVHQWAADNTELVAKLGLSINVGENKNKKNVKKTIVKRVKKDIIKVLRNMLPLSRSLREAALKSGISEFMKNVIMIGVDNELVIQAREKLRSRRGRRNGGVIWVHQGVSTLSAELFKAAVYGGPVEWGKSEGKWPMGENAHFSVNRHSSCNQAAQELIEMEKEMVKSINPRGPTEATEQRRSRIKAILRSSLDNQTPHYFLLDHDDPLYQELKKRENSHWKDSFVMLRHPSGAPVLEELELIEELVRLINQNLMKSNH